MSYEFAGKRELEFFQDFITDKKYETIGSKQEIDFVITRLIFIECQFQKLVLLASSPAIL